MSVTVEFPEELLVACREEKDFFQRRVMVLTLGKLYEEGKFYRELVLRFWDAIAQNFIV